MTDKTTFSVVPLLLVAAVVLAVGGGWFLYSFFSSNGADSVVSAADQKPPIEITKNLISGAKVSNQRELSENAFPNDTFPNDSEPNEPVSEADEMDEWRPSEKAVASLKDAMRYGDPRTPRLAESQQRELPSAQELADPALYLEYEARQQEQVYRSFLKASETKITELEALIAEGERDGGVSEEQLEEGRRKLEALRRSREEVIAEHPQAAQASDADSVEGAGSDSEEP